MCERDSQWHKWGENIQNRKLIEIKLTHSAPTAPVDKQGDYGNIDFPTTCVRNNTAHSPRIEKNQFEIHARPKHEHVLVQLDFSDRRWR